MTRILLASLLFAVSCYKTEYSHETREPGRVEQVTYNPGGTASGTGFSSKGSVVFTSTNIPDRYAIVFSCPHGKFTLNPEGENARRLFATLKQGDSVTISYREEFHVRDGVRELYKLDFLDAVPRR